MGRFQPKTVLRDFLGINVDYLKWSIWVSGINVYITNISAEKCPNGTYPINIYSGHPLLNSDMAPPYNQKR